MSDLERRLREFRAPGEASAAERARAASVRELRRQAPRRAPRRPVRSAVAAAVAAAVAGLALTPPGSAVADWVRDLVRPGGSGPERLPALSLPAPGRLLVTSPGGTWVVRRDGSARRIGAYEEATWSPGGLFVAATRDRTLAAVEPDGTVRWTLGGTGRLGQPRWAPSGFRVAYRSGTSLRVVAGDGSGDELLARRAGAAAPAWRPGRRHVLAYGSPAGAPVVRDTDSGRVLWRGAAGAAPVALAWSAGGRRLAVLRAGRLELLAPGGRRVESWPVPGTAIGLASSPRSDRLAVTVARPDGSGAVLLFGGRGPGPRTLLAAPGGTSAPVLSPGGRYAVVALGAEWVFVPAGAGRARAVSGIAARFDPRAETPRGMPRVEGWCCAAG